MTHPPGHPPGPTGPGRTITPGPADAAQSLSSGPGIDPIDAALEAHHTGIGEPHEHSTPAPRPPCTCGHDRVERMFHLAPCPRSERGERRPGLPEVIRDVDRLLAQARAILEQPVDPQSYPDGPLAHAVDIGFEILGLRLDADQLQLARIGELREMSTCKLQMERAGAWQPTTVAPDGACACGTRRQCPYTDILASPDPGH